MLTAPSKILGFHLYRITDLPEIQATLYELRHEKTGAEVMAIAADDDENFFNISFRTWPPSSNGVAHILEHTVLCGSKRFPIKDPFFTMSRRSLNTFMNAFTGGDFTCYPASSQVPQDFYNLLEVYLDSVFHPRLLKQSFLQEGHRLEFSEKDNSLSPLEYKGIVYNEMKGSLANPEARLSEEMMQALFPDLIYGLNSGGDPRKIPELTYEELKAFHRKFYHPSHALFFFYGNLPLERHLEFISKHALQDVENIESLPFLPAQKRRSTPFVKQFSYPISTEENLEDKSYVAFGWLTCHVLEQEEVLALNVIDLVLMGTDAAPLKLALLKSQLCKQTDSSLEDELSEIPYILVCKGCKSKDADAIETLIKKTLAECIEKGFSDDIVEGAIHQLQFSRSEISAPFGLALYFRSALLKQHGGKPEEGLKIHTLFKNLREKVKDPHYLPSLIQKYFLDNPHRVRLVMDPDPTLQAKEIAEEKMLLEDIQKSLSKEKIQEIIETSQKLEAYQEEEEDEEALRRLPQMKLSDIPRDCKDFPLIKEDKGALKLFCHPCFTNEILYTDLYLNLPAIAESDLPILRLFSLLLPQLGCGARDYKKTLNELFEHTGGISIDLELASQADNPDVMKPALVFRGKALYRKANHLFSFLKEMIASPDFKDVSRIRELLTQHYEELESHIQHSPLRYAIQLGASGLSLAGHIRNVWYGLSYFYRIKEIVNEFEKDPTLLISALESMQQRVLVLQDAHLVLGCDQAMYHHLKKQEFYGLCDSPVKERALWKGDYSFSASPSQGRIIAAPVAFTAFIFKTCPYTNPFCPLLSLAAKIMENKTLHKRIREQGGAYGSGSSNAPMAAQFYFYTYRDPHLASSYEAFKEAISELQKGNFDEDEMEEAKLGVIQDLDSPTAPGSRSSSSYERLRSGRTFEKRQAFRTHLLEASKEEIIEVAETLLAPGFEQGVLVSFGGKELLEKESSLLQKNFPLYSI